MALRISPIGLLCSLPYEGQNAWGKALSLTILANTTAALNWTSLGLDPVAFSIGFFQVRWYSLAYITGIILGWWYLTKLIAKPGAPMARRHVDDFVFYATLGIILGGRLGYCLFYHPEMLLTLQVFQVWNGGMSFHGGVIGVTIGLIVFARVHKLNWLRLHDYVACVYPIGHFLGRIANFINGELWGRPTDVAWGMIFPMTRDDLPRHPSQLYEAGIEGILLGLILWFLFFKTDARYKPGFLVGHFILWMGVFRFAIEYFREPDAGITGLLGMSMGQTLSVPMVLGGLYLVFTAKGRRERVEAIAGTEAVA
jgi:phosphatidylglycerol:prolipoprotein diacylglycerol transferase